MLSRTAALDGHDVDSGGPQATAPRDHLRARRQPDSRVVSRPVSWLSGGCWNLTTATIPTCTPDLTVRRNYPYAGKGDGLTDWFRRHFPPGAYVEIALEVNQKHVFTAGRQWTQGDHRITVQGAREP